MKTLKRLIKEVREWASPEDKTDDLSLEWGSFIIAEPLWLLLLILIPVIIFIRHRAKIRESTLRFSSLDKIEKIKSGKVRIRLWIPLWLRYSSIACLIFAISRPQHDRSTQTILSSGVDIVLAVDLSASMLALDMSEGKGRELTRLDVVKEVIGDFIDKRQHDRIGLVAFSVDPYLVSALTLDKEHLRKNLARLRVGLTHQTGTNIGSALAEGINRLRSLESKSKILILLTDGKDEPPPPHSPMIYAQGAKKDNIKIYTIAIGSNARTRTYLFDPTTRDIMRYPNNNPVIRVADFPVDKEILQRISKSTDAQFFEAQDKKALSLIYDEIDRLEKSEVELSVNAIYEELFPWALALGLVFLILEIVLSRTIFLKVP